MVTFFFAITMILIISVVFDVVEKIDDFYENSPPIFDVIFVYYKNFLLKYGIMLSSFFTFISVIFFTSSLAGKSEIVPMFCSGISLRRLLLPYLMGASIITGITFIGMQWYLPNTSKSALDFEMRYLRNKKPSRFYTIHRQLKPNHFIFFKSYNTKKYSGNNFTYEIFKGNELEEKLFASRIDWNSDSSKWELKNWYTRDYTENGEILDEGKIKFLDLGLNPEDIVHKVQSATLMDYQELSTFIDREKFRGSENVQFYEIEFYQRGAFAFSNIILTIIAVCISARKTRGGIGINLALGLAFIMIYVMMSRVGITFAQYSDFNPILATWLPNIIYGLATVYFFRKAQK